MLQCSVPVKNRRLDAISEVVGPDPKIRIFTEPFPPNVTDLPAGSLLVEINLPEEWSNAAADGEKSLRGMPIFGFAQESGKANYFRIYDAEDVCHVQGTVSLSGQTGDLLLSAVDLVKGQQVLIESFVIVD